MNRSHQLEVELFEYIASHGTMDFLANYFMTTIDNQMCLFEKNLKFLEQYTGELSKLLENNISAIKNQENPQQEPRPGSEFIAEMGDPFKPISSNCEKQRWNLLDQIRKGYQENWWITLEELERKVNVQETQNDDREEDRLIADQLDAEKKIQILCSPAARNFSQTANKTDFS